MNTRLPDLVQTLSSMKRDGIKLVLWDQISILLKWRGHETYTWT